MEPQKIVNLFNNFDNKSSKFSAKKWYGIHDQNSNTDYGEGNETGTSVTIETTVIESRLCDY